MNEPAFPVEFTNHTDSNLLFSGTTVAPNTKITCLGLSVRDYFAAKAMAGSLAGVPGPHLVPHTLAREAYAMADAMLKERQS